MELSWINKARIALVAGFGIIVIGILAWPLAAPEDPLAPVRASTVGLGGTVVLLALAFSTGFAGYFIAWPHGREIGILGVPFALAVWAGRSGPMRTLTQALDEPFEREALLASLSVEPFYWLLIVAAGFAGVLAAQYLRPGSQPPLTTAQIKSYLKPAFCGNIAGGRPDHLCRDCRFCRGGLRRKEVPGPELSVADPRLHSHNSFCQNDLLQDGDHSGVR